MSAKRQARFSLALAALSVFCFCSSAAFGQCFYVSLPTWTAYYTNDQLSDLVGMCNVEHCSESCWGEVTPYTVYSPQSIDCLPPGCSECWPPNCGGGERSSQPGSNWLPEMRAISETSAVASCPQGEKAASALAIKH